MDMSYVVLPYTLIQATYYYFFNLTLIFYPNEEKRKEK